MSRPFHCIGGHLGIKNGLRVEGAVVITDPGMIAPDDEVTGAHILTEIGVQHRFTRMQALVHIKLDLKATFDANPQVGRPRKTHRRVETHTPGGSGRARVQSASPLHLPSLSYAFASYLVEGVPLSFSVATFSPDHGN